MQLFFVLAALVALVASQCNVEGNTYTNGDHWITFGTEVDNFIPAILSLGGDSSVHFATWRKADNQNDGTSLWEVREIGATGDLLCGDSRPAGVYDISFSENCGDLTIALESDFLCEPRQEFFGNGEFSVQQFSECGTEGNDITGRLSESDASTALSHQAADITYGANGYVIVSISDDAAIFQHWTAQGSDVTIVDFMSFPDGFACDAEVVGNYALDWETDTCGLRVCGNSDGCLERAQLMHNAGFNAYSGASCADDFTDAHAPDVFGGCSDGTQWREPATACTDQSSKVLGGCAFCGGRVGGKDIHICVARNGIRCNTLREQIGVFQLCNLDFECDPASVVTVSMFLLVTCLLGLLF